MESIVRSKQNWVTLLRMTASTASSVSNVTKPKPLDLFVARSTMTTTSYKKPASKYEERID